MTTVENVMSAEDQQKMQAQLDEWRGKLDELRVKGHLLKMEYRDKQDVVVGDMEQAYAAAKAKFLELKAATETETGKLSAGFTSAWSAFKEAYDKHTESSE